MRLLDVFSLHYYPQGGEFSDDVSTAMQQRRNRSTRSLWDPNYVDETWINDRVRLIPRMREWVDAQYPGRALAVTEYSWGAEGHINGATAQADVLGIFGREGLNIGTRWVVPATTTPTFKAFQMYRNYDGSRVHLRRDERAGRPSPTRTPWPPSPPSGPRTARSPSWRSTRRRPAPRPRSASPASPPARPPRPGS